MTGAQQAGAEMVQGAQEQIDQAAEEAQRKKEEFARYLMEQAMGPLRQFRPQEAEAAPEQAPAEVPEVPPAPNPTPTPTPTPSPEAPTPPPLPPALGPIERPTEEDFRPSAVSQQGPIITPRPTQPPAPEPAPTPTPVPEPPPEPEPTPQPPRFQVPGLDGLRARLPQNFDPTMGLGRGLPEVGGRFDPNAAGAPPEVGGRFDPNAIGPEAKVARLPEAPEGAGFLQRVGTKYVNEQLVDSANALAGLRNEPERNEALESLSKLGAYVGAGATPSLAGAGTPLPLNEERARDVVEGQRRAAQELEPEDLARIAGYAGAAANLVPTVPEQAANLAFTGVTTAAEDRGVPEPVAQGLGMAATMGAPVVGTALGRRFIPPGVGQEAAETLARQAGRLHADETGVLASSAAHLRPEPGYRYIGVDDRLMGLIERQGQVPPSLEARLEPSLAASDTYLKGDASLPAGQENPRRTGTLRVPKGLAATGEGDRLTAPIHIDEVEVYGDDGQWHPFAGFRARPEYGKPTRELNVNPPPATRPEPPPPPGPLNPDEFGEWGDLVTRPDERMGPEDHARLDELDQRLQAHGTESRPRVGAPGPIDNPDEPLFSTGQQPGEPPLPRPKNDDTYTNSRFRGQDRIQRAREVEDVDLSHLDPWEAGELGPDEWDDVVRRAKEDRILRDNGYEPTAMEPGQRDEALGELESQDFEGQYADDPRAERRRRLIDDATERGASDDFVDELHQEGDILGLTDDEYERRLADDLASMNEDLEGRRFREAGDAGADPDWLDDHAQRGTFRDISEDEFQRLLQDHLEEPSVPAEPGQYPPVMGEADRDYLRLRGLNPEEMTPEEIREALIPRDEASYRDWLQSRRNRGEPVEEVDPGPAQLGRFRREEAAKQGIDLSDLSDEDLGTMGSQDFVDRLRRGQGGAPDPFGPENPENLRMRERMRDDIGARRRAAAERNGWDVSDRTDDQLGAMSGDDYLNYLRGKGIDPEASWRTGNTYEAPLTPDAKNPDIIMRVRALREQHPDADIGQLRRQALREAGRDVGQLGDAVDRADDWDFDNLVARDRFPGANPEGDPYALPPPEGPPEPPEGGLGARPPGPGPGPAPLAPDEVDALRNLGYDVDHPDFDPANPTKPLPPRGPEEGGPFNPATGEGSDAYEQSLDDLIENLQEEHGTNRPPPRPLNEALNRGLDRIAQADEAGFGGALDDSDPDLLGRLPQEDWNDTLDSLRDMRDLAPEGLAGDDLRDFLRERWAEAARLAREEEATGEVADVFDDDPFWSEWRRRVEDRAAAREAGGESTLRPDWEEKNALGVERRLRARERGRNFNYLTDEELGRLSEEDFQEALDDHFAFPYPEAPPPSGRQGGAPGDFMDREPMGPEPPPGYQRPPVNEGPVPGFPPEPHGGEFPFGGPIDLGPERSNIVAGRGDEDGAVNGARFADRLRRAARAAMDGSEFTPFDPATGAGERAADLTGGVVGGVAGAATGPEDQTPQERAKRGALGFVLGSTVPGRYRALARDFNLYDEGSRLLADETGSLGVTPGGRGPGRPRQYTPAMRTPPTRTPVDYGGQGPLPELHALPRDLVAEEVLQLANRTGPTTTRLLDAAKDMPPGPLRDSVIADARRAQGDYIAALKARLSPAEQQRYTVEYNLQRQGQQPPTPPTPPPTPPQGPQPPTPPQGPQTPPTPPTPPAPQAPAVPPKISLREGALSNMYSGLLANPVNAAADFAVARLEPGWKTVRDNILSVKDPDKKWVMLAEDRGQRRGRQEGLANALEIFRTGKDIDELVPGAQPANVPRSLYRRAELRQQAQGGEGFNKRYYQITETPMRARNAADAYTHGEIFYQHLYREAAQSANANARTTGVANDRPGQRGWFDHFDDFVNTALQPNLSPQAPEYAAREEAIKQADRALGRNDPGKIGNLAGRLFEHDALKPFFPLFRTTYNLGVRGMERSPLGFANPLYDLARGRKPRPEAVVDAAMGSALFAPMVIAAVTHGDVTGYGPDDKQTRDTLMAQGWRPYSIRMPGNRYVSYRRFGATAAPLAMAGAIGDAVAFRHAGEPGPATLGRAASDFGRWFGDQFFLRNLGDLQRASVNLNTELPTWAARLLNTQNPLSNQGAGFVANALDPYQRDTNPEGADGMEVFVNEIKNNVPLLRQQLEPKYDDFGMPVPNPRYGLGALNPFTTGPSDAENQDTRELRKYQDSESAAEDMRMDEAIERAKGFAQVGVEPDEETQDLLGRIKGGNYDYARRRAEALAAAAERKRERALARAGG